MDAHIKWLQELLKSAEEKAREAEKEVSVLKEALILARREHKDSQEEGLQKRRWRKPTLLDVAEEVLEDHGPCTSEELLYLLEQQGKKTTLNSLTVSLNRERPQRFDKNKEKKWHLVSEEKPERLIRTGR